jgi:hypothetical protein
MWPLHASFSWVGVAEQSGNPPSVSRTCSMLGVMGRSPGMLSKSAADSPMGYSVNRRLSGGGMSFVLGI